MHRKPNLLTIKCFGKRFEKNNYGFKLSIAALGVVEDSSSLKENSWLCRICQQITEKSLILICKTVENNMTIQVVSENQRKLDQAYVGMQYWFDPFFNESKFLKLNCHV